MSDKLRYEDKSEDASLPRSLTNLLTVTDELKQAVSRQRAEQVQSLLGDLEKAWRTAQSDNIGIYSRQGDQLNCARYADALNAANGVLFSARALLQR